MVECAATGNELILEETVAATEDEATDSTVVTYYSDVCDEVDAHFARALLQQESSLPTTPSSDPQSYQHQDSCSGAAAQHSAANLNLPIPEQCLSPSFTDTSSMAFSMSPPQLLNDHFIPSPSCNNHLSQTGSSFETASISPSPSLAPPSLLPPPSTLSQQPLLHQFPAAQWQSNPTILYPELSRYLVHPHIDPYSDTPRVPGQLKGQYATPLPPQVPDMWEPSLPHYQSTYPQTLQSPSYIPYSGQYSPHPYYDPPLAYSSDPYFPPSPAPSGAAVHPYNPYSLPSTNPYTTSNGYWESQAHSAITPPPYGSVRHQVFSAMNNYQQIATLQ